MQVQVSGGAEMFPLRFGLEDGVEIWWRKRRWVTILPLLFPVMMVGAGAVAWAARDGPVWLALFALFLILLPSILVAALICFGSKRAR